MICLQWLTEHQAAVKWDHVEHNAEAFAIFIRPRCTHFRPDTTLFTVLAGTSIFHVKVLQIC